MACASSNRYHSLKSSHSPAHLKARQENNRRRRKERSQLEVIQNPTSVDLKRGNEIAVKVGDREETDVGGG